MVVHRGKVLPESVDLHGVLGVARGTVNAQADDVVLHEVPQRLLLIRQDWRRLGPSSSSLAASSSHFAIDC